MSDTGDSWNRRDRLSHNFRFWLSYLERSLNHSRFWFRGRRLRKKCTFLDLLDSAGLTGAI
jgi:hypothetical protein